MRYCMIILSTLLAVSLAACGHDDHASPAADACEHMQDGPIQAVAAAAESSPEAPALADTHTRYDVTLTGEAGALVGHVNLPIAGAAEHIVFLDTDVPVELRDSQDALVAAEAVDRAIDECVEVAAGHTFDLGVGTYSLRFGPAAAERVSVVLVPADGHGH
jgi:hypothetical protein